MFDFSDKFYQKGLTVSDFVFAAGSFRNNRSNDHYVGALYVGLIDPHIIWPRQIMNTPELFMGLVESLSMAGSTKDILQAGRKSNVKNYFSSGGFDSYLAKSAKHTQNDYVIHKIFNKKNNDSPYCRIVDISKDNTVIKKILPYNVYDIPYRIQDDPHIHEVQSNFHKLDTFKNDWSAHHANKNIIDRWGSYNDISYGRAVRFIGTHSFKNALNNYSRYYNVPIICEDHGAVRKHKPYGNFGAYYKDPTALFNTVNIHHFHENGKPMFDYAATEHVARELTRLERYFSNDFSGNNVQFLPHRFKNEMRHV